MVSAEGQWAAASNAFYVVPLVLAWWYRRWVVMVALVLLSGVSSAHHYCHADGEAHCDHEWTVQLQRLDHVLAIWTSSLLLLLLVPFRREDWKYESGWQLVALGGSLLAVYLGMDTALADLWAALVVTVTLVGAAISLRWGLHSSTLGWLCELLTCNPELERGHFCASARCLVLQWWSAFVLLGISLFLWFYSNWSDDPIYHGAWHATTALVAALLLSVFPRAQALVEKPALQLPSVPSFLLREERQRLV